MRTKINQAFADQRKRFKQDINLLRNNILTEIKSWKAFKNNNSDTSISSKINSGFAVQLISKDCLK